MRTLYHFEQSVYSRRTRLALAHKGIEVELKDGRVDEAHLTAARALQPIRTIPVLVEEDGQALADSNAIVHYLDHAYRQAPTLIPQAAARETLAIMTAIDVAMDAVVDLGTRLHDLSDHDAWSDMKSERIARAQGAIDWVATKATRPMLAGKEWSAADIWVYSATRWVAAWPSRVDSSPAVAKMVKLGFTLPGALVAWSKRHDSRDDVRSIYG